MFIPIEQPPIMRISGQSPEGCFRSAIDKAIGFDQLNRPLTLFARQLGKFSWQPVILKGQIFDLFTGYVLPATDPQAAKSAIAVIDQQRLGGQRRYAYCGLHKADLGPWTLDFGFIS